MMMKYCLILFLVIEFSLYAPQLTIITAGAYTFETNINFSPSISDSAIIINASNVLLDLSGRALVQGNLIAGVNGIIVNPNLSNVTIKNGSIQNFTGKGISIGQGCSQIIIDSILTFSCDTRAIEFIGTSTSNQIVDSQIKNCQLISCLQGSTGDFVLTLSQCARVKVLDSSINNNGTKNFSISAVHMESSNNCIFENVSVFGNSGSTIKGFELIAPTQCAFNKCFVRNNSATGTNQNFSAFDLSGSSNTFNIFTNCIAEQNTSLGVDFGFSLTANCQNNFFKNCFVLSNTGGTMIGFHLTGGTANNLKNIFIDCIASQNLATANNSTGFLINGSNFGSLIRCIASDNISNKAIAAGLSFESLGGNNWEVNDCKFHRNNGNIDANSFGINRLVPIINNSLFFCTVAFHNGLPTSAAIPPLVVANQLNGTPSTTTPTDPATNNMNATIFPYTNMIITR
jgi:hypothetical protein